MKAKKIAPKKSSLKKTRSKKLQRGKIVEKPLLIVVIILLLLGGLVFVIKPWTFLPIPLTAHPIAVVKPSPDLGRARQLTIDPTKKTIMQIVTREKVRITLEVPVGALKEKTLVKMIPFYYEKKSQSPTAGVIVGPAAISFLRPVTLSFNFSESTFKNTAPKNLRTITIRPTGKSQVLQIDSQATSYTPTLIARGLETETYLPARIMTGGAYVFSLDGQNQVSIAKKSLAEKNMNTLTVLEDATSVLFNGETLSHKELTKAKGAVTKILSQKQPLAQELFAAVVLQRKINGKKFSVVPKAFAYDETEGYFQIACKTEGLSVEEYLGFAQTAQLLGHDAIGDNCLKKAKNLVAEEAKKILANPDVDLKTVISQLKDVQIMGLDDETNLGDQLTEKAKEVAVKDAKKVTENKDATPIEAAKQLQVLEALGVESGPTYESLSDTVKKSTEKFDEPIDDPYDAEATIDEEDILANQAMSAMGVAMLQAFGIKEYDEASMKKMWDDQEDNLKELNEAVYAMCKELEGDDCASKHSDIAQQIEDGQRESYRLAEQVGEVQSREYEDPEYLENSGDVELYFEAELTPTPEENSDGVVEDNQDDMGTTDEDQGLQVQEVADTPTPEEEPSDN